MASKTLTFKILAEDADALKAFGAIARGAQKDMGKASKALEGTETAGAKMAKGLEAAAAQIEAEMLGLRSASDRLAEALGPELANASEQGVDSIVLDLRRAGLTFAEIEADADRLAAAVKRLDDVKPKIAVRGMNDLATSTRKVGTEADRSRGVMANFMGNAAQDLPIVNQSMGAVNVAVGQFAEYATEGGIALKGLVATAGPLIGVTVALGTLNWALEHYKGKGERVKQATEELTQAMKDGKSALEAYTEAAEEQRKVTVETFWGTKDVTKQLSKLGLTFDQFTQLTQASSDDLLDWFNTAQAGGADFRALYDVMLAVSESTHKMDAATSSSRAALEVFGYTQRQVIDLGGQYQALSQGIIETEQRRTAALYAVADGADRAAEESGFLEENTKGVKKAEDEAAKAAEDMAKKIIGAADAVEARFNTKLGLDKATKEAIDGFTALDKVLKDSKSTDLDKKIALEEQAQRLWNASKATGDLATSNKTYATDAEKAADATLAQIDNLTKMRDNLAPDAPLRVYLQDYINDLKGSAGEFVAKLKLRLEASVANGTAGSPFIEDVYAGTNGVPGRAAGGPVKAGMPYLVNENTPNSEVVTFGRDGYVHPRAMAPVGGGDTYIEVHNHVAGHVLTERELVTLTLDGLVDLKNRGVDISRLLNA